MRNHKSCLTRRHHQVQAADGQSARRIPQPTEPKAYPRRPQCQYGEKRASKGVSLGGLCSAPEGQMSVYMGGVHVQNSKADAEKPNQPTKHPTHRVAQPASNRSWTTSLRRGRSETLCLRRKRSRRWIPPRMHPSRGVLTPSPCRGPSSRGLHTQPDSAHWAKCASHDTLISGARGMAQAASKRCVMLAFHQQ